MIAGITQFIVVVAVILFLEWSVIVKANKISKWFTFSLLGLSGVLWLFIVTKVHMVRPITYVEKLIKPFSFLQ